MELSRPDSARLLALLTEQLRRMKPRHEQHAKASVATKYSNSHDDLCITCSVE